MLFKSQLRLLRMINSWEQVAYNHLEQAELKEDIWDVLPEIQDLPRVLGSCWMVKWAMWHVVLQFYCSNFITIQLVSIVYTENDTFKCMSILTILVVWIFKYPCIHIWYICMHIYTHTHHWYPFSAHTLKCIPPILLPRMWLAPRLQWKQPWLHYNRWLLGKFRWWHGKTGSESSLGIRAVYTVSESIVIREAER